MPNARCAPRPGSARSVPSPIAPHRGLRCDFSPTTVTAPVVAIVGHTSRQAMIDELAAAIVEPAAVLIDDGRLGCTANHRRAWETLHRRRSQAEWGVVLEDDAVPVDGFRDQLTIALQAAPANGQPCEVNRTAWRTGTRKAWSATVTGLMCGC
jgi:GR25 family glycosyltransferase involved in LPS biosynthesis